MLRIDFMLNMLLLNFILNTDVGLPKVFLWHIERKQVRQELIQK